MVLRPRHALIALVLAGTLGLTAHAAPATPPLMGGQGAPAAPATAVTPPQTALAMLQEALKEHGRKSGFDADYGAINRQLLASLADAIDMVEHSPRPARQGARIEPVMTTWRTMNRDFVAQLSRDSATLRTLAEQPIRYRLAEQSLYEMIVLAVRKNVACFRDMAGEWTAPVAS